MNPLSKVQKHIYTEENKGILDHFKSSNPKPIIDDVFDEAKETVQKLQKKETLVSACPDGGKVALQIDESLFDPRGIKKILPNKIDKQTKKRIGRFTQDGNYQDGNYRVDPSELRKTSSELKADLNALKRNQKSGKHKRLVREAFRIEKEAKASLKWQAQRSRLNPEDFRDRRSEVLALYPLVKEAEAIRWAIQSNQPPLVSSHPFTKEETHVVAHRLNRDNGTAELWDNAVVPNAEETKELKSFYTVDTATGNHIGRHAVADSREKVDSLYAHLDRIEKDSKGPVRALFCQLNAYEIKRERKMIDNQHLQMARLENRFQKNDRDVEVAHLNLSTNGFYDVNRKLKRILPSGLVDFIMPGEKESALLNTTALVTYIRWLQEEDKISVEKNLYDDLLDFSDKIKEKSVELEKLIHDQGSKHEIATLRSEITHLREELQKKLIEGVNANDIQSEGRVGAHYLALLKSQLAIEPISRGRELLIKNILNERLGIHSFSNCKSGFDRTGFAFALELGLTQFSSQIEHLLKNPTENDNARVQKEVLHNTDKPILRLTKLLTHYTYDIGDLTKLSGQQMTRDDLYTPLTDALDGLLDKHKGNARERFFAALKAAELALQGSGLSDSEQREILKQVVALATSSRYGKEYSGFKELGLKWIKIQAVDRLVDNWDKISLKQNETEDVQTLRTHVFKNLLELGLPIIFRGVGVLGLKWGKGHRAQLIPLRFIPPQIKVKTKTGATTMVDIVKYDKTGNVVGLTKEGHRLITRLSNYRGD